MSEDFEISEPPQQARIDVEPFPIDPADPLASEHRVVAEWVAAVLGALPEHRYYQDVELKSVPAGATMLAADAAQARRYVLAALAQACYWDREVDRLRAAQPAGYYRENTHLHSQWPAVWGNRRQSAAVIQTLMRRTLPFDEADLLALLAWANAQDRMFSRYHTPLAAIAKASARHAAETSLTPAMLGALRTFARRLRASRDKADQRLATSVEQLCADAPIDADTPAGPGRLVARVAAGDARVHQLLKQTLGLRDAPPTASMLVTGHDRYAVPDDSPLRAEHEQLSGVFADYIERVGYNNPDLNETEAGRAVLAAAPDAQARLLLAASERVVAGNLAATDFSDHRVWQARAAAVGVFQTLSQLDVPLERDALFDLLLMAAALGNHRAAESADAMDGHIAAAAGFDAASPLTDGERYVLHLVRIASIGGPPLGVPDDRRAG